MLSNGLNFRKKTQEVKSKSKSAISAFDEEQQDDISQQITRRGYTAPGKSSLKRTDHEETDQVYDYDGVYDAMKTGEREALKRKEVDKKERKPKYMQNLFSMAEVRKQDRLRAEDVKLQREREAEGDEFADKEKFVTGAYKAQQEEARKLQKEEEEREAALRRKAGGLAAFKQNLLQKDQEEHEAAVRASLHAKDRPVNDLSEMSGSKQLEQDKIRLAEANVGHQIAVNDDNQVVDQRDLLGAGLNRMTKSDKHLQTAELAKKVRPVVMTQQERTDRQAQIDRQQRLLKTQLEESRKRQAEDVDRQQAALKAQAKRTKTETDVSSAKERYLARKKAEAEAAGKAKADAI